METPGRGGDRPLEAADAHAQPESGYAEQQAAGYDAALDTTEIEQPPADGHADKHEDPNCEHCQAKALRAEEFKEVGEEFDDSDPAERVEYFLTITADIFTAAKQTWRDVRAALIAIKQTVQPDANLYRQMGNRSLRRNPRLRTFFESQGWDSQIAEAQKNARELFEENNKRIGAVKLYPPEKFDAPVDEFQKGLRDNFKEHPLYNPNDIGDDVGSEGMAIFDNFNLLRDRTLEGHIMDRSIDLLLRDFLEDRPAAAPLVERIKGMLEDESAAQEFPGFLEAVANHVRKHADRSPLAIAYKEGMPDPATKAEEFMTAVLEGRAGIKQDRIRMQMDASVYATKMFVERDDDTWLSTAAERWAAQYDQWEDWHKAELTNYVTRQHNGHWNEFVTALSRHVHAGRLAGMSITGDQRIRSSRGLKVDKVFTAELQAAAAEPETKREPEVISKFALLERAGTGSRSSNDEFVIAEVSDIAALLKSKPFADYLSRFSEKEMEGHFSRALEHLTTDWFDKKTTRRLVGVTYTTDETKQRHARRLSLRSLPGVPRNTVASQTRIIYDVCKINGQNCLIVRGPFNKPEIENMRRMP